VAIFKLDDGSEAIEAVANEELIDAHKELLKEDTLVIVQGKVQPDRFSGGLRLNVSALWGLAAARARFGRHVRLALKADAQVRPLVDLVGRWPARRIHSEQGELLQGLGLRLCIRRPCASADLDLGDAGRFWPEDDALACLAELDESGLATIVYAEPV
jgi:DNA polymerase-3 subunit alpha